MRRATCPSWFKIKIGIHLYETVTDNNLHDEQNSEFFQSAAKKRKNLAIYYKFLVRFLYLPARLNIQPVAFHSFFVKLVKR